jgi:hypothetical protein
MHADRARPGAGTRLRLMDLSLAGNHAEFGGGLASVFVGTSDRTPVANAIASAVIGPRPAGITGTIEIAGRYVDLQTLPAPLLRPSATPLVDRLLLDDLWQEVCGQRRARIEAAHASRRVLRHRVGASLERARERARELAEPPAPAPAPAPVEAPVVAPAPARLVPAPDIATPVLQELLAAYGDLAPIPAPEALTLADEFDELAARPDIVIDETVDLDLVALEARVTTARRAVAPTAGIVHPEVRSHIEEAHRSVVEAESALYEARKKDKAEALSLYQAALASEHAVLAEAGVESYAQFLVTIAQGVPQVDLEARWRAETELADAQTALQEARATLALMHDGREELALELRARAAQLLGHFPGDDPAVELRALRVDHPDAEAVRTEVRRTLGSIDIAPERDAIGQARRVVADRIANPPMIAEPEPEPIVLAAVEDADEALPLRELDAGLAEERLALHAEIADLQRECDELDELLDAFERELDYLDEVGTRDSATIDADARNALFDALFACYRDGDLLAGRLPMVMDGVLDGMEPADVRHVAERLQLVDDIQVIVVTSDREVERALDQVGARPVAMYAEPRRGGERAQRAAPPTSFCFSHPAELPTASCSQCGRPSCLECLAYVPGEAELWCVTCADTRTRRLRLLRRRGA